jgi:hypothetical protein
MFHENRSVHNSLFVPAPLSGRVRSRTHAGSANRRAFIDIPAADRGVHDSANQICGNYCPNRGVHGSADQSRGNYRPNGSGIGYLDQVTCPVHGD